jgi:cyclase
MKRLAILVAIVAGGLTAWAVAQPRGPREMKVQRVADNLYVISDNYDGNTAVFIRNDGVVLVDTKSVAGGRQLIEAIKGITSKPITHILNTHEHYDHVGGNAYFPQHVEVIAHENAVQPMNGMKEFATPETRHGLPDKTFKDRLTLFSGADAIELFYFGAAHTNNDAFIVFRGHGVLHAGDTYPGVNNVTRSGGSASDYPRTMDRAAKEITGVRTVIPGHGPLTDWQAFVSNAASLQKSQ